MDTKYVDPVIVAVKHVFKAMLDIDLEHGSPFVKNDKKSTGDVTGIMGLTGTEGHQRGVISFSSSRQGALAIYERLMHEGLTEVTPDVVDGIGELTNIISGRARYELEKEHVVLYAHVPLVLVGKKAEVNFITRTPIVSIPFYFNSDDEKEQINVDFVFE